MALKEKKETKETSRGVEKVSRARGCYFCESRKEPDYKDVEGISNFVTDRARILGRSRSGVCSKHQRRLSTAIKRARHIGLLPFKMAV
jgi:small subunit ribosomal protein S18